FFPALLGTLYIVVRRPPNHKRGIFGGRRGWAAAARCFHCPQRSWLRERSPGGLQAAPTSNGKSGVLSGTPPPAGPLLRRGQDPALQPYGRSEPPAKPRS